MKKKEKGGGCKNWVESGEKRFQEKRFISLPEVKDVLTRQSPATVGLSPEFIN